MDGQRGGAQYLQKDMNVGQTARSTLTPTIRDDEGINDLSSQSTQHRRVRSVSLTRLSGTHDKPLQSNLRNVRQLLHTEQKQPTRAHLS